MRTPKMVKTACAIPGQGAPQTGCGSTRRSVTRDEVVLVAVVLIVGVVLLLIGMPPWAALGFPVVGATAVVVVSRREPSPSQAGLRRAVAAWAEPAPTA